MSLLSVRLPKEMVKKIDHNAQILHLQRSEYIRQSINAMNKSLFRKIRENRLVMLSKKVRASSQTVIDEFNEIENDPKN